MKQTGLRTPGRWLSLVVIVLGTIVSRVPVMLSPFAVLDGDECVVATMAKFLYQGRGPFKLFFWGQDYGFSLLECLSIQPFYLLFGFGTLAVQCGMLSLWILGGFFFYLTLTNVTAQKWTPLLFTLILMVHPSWGLWALKARGGYLTAFCLSNLTLWLAFRSLARRHTAIYLLIGLLICLVYESQPLWLVGLLPLTGYALSKSPRRRLAILLTFFSFCAAFVAFHVYRQPFKDNIPTAYSPELKEFPDLLARLPSFFYGSFHGKYRFADFDSPDAFSAISSWILCLVLVFLIITGIIRLFLKKRYRDPLFLSSVLFIPLIVGYTFLAKYPEGRYLLPAGGFSLLALQVLIRHRQEAPGIIAAQWGTVLIATVATFTFYSFREQKATKETLSELLTSLKVRGIYNTYSTDCMLPWQITFYSDETIQSRMFYLPGRHLPYTLSVDRAFDAGKKTALVSYSREYPEMQRRPVRVNDDFVISLDPTREDLGGAFRFTDPVQRQ